jgi:hypothetical protein
MTTPNDTNEPSLASAGSQPVAIMSWEQADQIIQDQRAEIARLQVNLRLADAGFTLGSPMLTDEEREAIERDLSWLQWCEDNRQIGDVGRKDIATLRGLLQRLG